MLWKTYSGKQISASSQTVKRLWEISWAPHSSLAAALKVTKRTLIGCFKLLFGNKLKTGREFGSVFMFISWRQSSAYWRQIIICWVFIDSNKTFFRRSFFFLPYAQLIETKKTQRLLYLCFCFWVKFIHSTKLIYNLLQYFKGYASSEFYDNFSKTRKSDLKLVSVHFQ